MSHEILVRKVALISTLSLMFFALLVSGVNASADQVRIVVFGDSLVAGYGLEPGEAFPEQMQSALRQRGHDVIFENAGVSGDTTSGGLSRLDWSVPDGTDAVILELGANDALRGIPPGVTRKNLDEMITKLKARNIDVLLAGMLAPPNMGEDYEEEFNSIYPELAESHGIAFYPFFLDGVASEASLNQADGMHPTADGVQKIVTQIMPDVEKLLDRLKAS